MTKKKNVKPYNKPYNKSNDKGYANSSNKNYNDSNKKKNNSNNKNRNHQNDFSKRDKKQNFENTTRIRIDKDRLDDAESLDTSFLEGRVKNDKVLKKAVGVTKSRRISKKKIRVDFNLIASVFIIVVISVVVAFAGFSLVNLITGTNKVVEEKVITKEVVKTVVDDNYLFLGDSITDFYDLEEYYKDLPVVNSGKSGNSTEDILNDMRNRVYKYNPSKIFLLIGTNDLIYDISNEETISNIEKIIDEIKENRPYSEIYLESIYPVNDSDDDKIDHSMVKGRKNDDIKKINIELEKMAKEKKINYINFYDILKDEDDNLKLEYTKEGLHMSDEGYEVITEEIMKYIKS